MSAPAARAARYDGWPTDAVAAVERAIAVHGGLARWKNVRALHLDFGSLAGALPALKGYRRTFPAPRSIEVHPHQRTTIFHGYPDADRRGQFIDGDVSIERAADGAVLESSARHRRTFDGLAKYRRWRPLDALYFFGYALWHYHALPFTLPETRFVRLLRHGRRLPGVEVVFAPDVPTHSRRQRFYFGGDGRIVRHDYVADIVGAWARGCHFWEAYDTVGGLAVAMRRRVVARL
ncbi:MAG TPA: hypothetical protein VMU50_09110, partial [Polyangia bacterium]|nr:hypothetical protein [Polyangia bacterium]